MGRGSDAMSQTHDAPSPPPVPQIRKFRWLQFSLRSLLILMLLAGLVFAWWSQRIRRQEREEQAIRLLAECPDPLGWEYNPVPLVRAVNHLQRMGKADAIKALRRFAAENPNVGYRSPHQSLEFVVPLLFDRMEPEDRFPDGPFPWDENIKEFELVKREWQIWMDVEGDIPFHTVHIGGTSGMPGDQTYLVEWADLHGRLRTTPLRPVDNPFEAAERELARLKKPDDDEGVFYWTQRHIYVQVHAAVSPLVSTGDPEQDYELTPYDVEIWNKLKERCLALGIHWSDETQAYVAAKQ